MERVRNTKIHWEGQERRLLDEVDVISSVSGGSFTAAYYGLLREELFDPARFEKAFLYRNTIPYSSCWTHSKVGAGRKLPTPRAKVFFKTNVLPAKCGHQHLIWQTVLRFISASTRLRMRKSGRIFSTCPPLSLCRGKRLIDSEESVRKFSTNRKSIKNFAQNLDARRNSVAFPPVLLMRIALCGRKPFRNLYFHRSHIGML